MNDQQTEQYRWWEETWPLNGRDWIRLIGALVVVVLVGVVVGELLTNWSMLSGLVDLDVEIAEDLAAGRTDLASEIAHWSSFIADTPVKIGLSLVIAAFLVFKFKRWHEAVMVIWPLIFEAIAYIVTSTIVGRPRPDVERLLESPVDTTFPSGHVAAATVYAALAVVVFWHTRAVWARTLAAGLSIVAPIMVAWARLYQGMHFLTDVIAGIVLGIVSVIVVLRILGPPETSVDQSSTADETDQVPA